MSQESKPRSNEIHVHSVDTASCEAYQAEFEALLDETERAAANRFLFPRHKAEYVAAHGAMRILLAGYCGCGPEEMRFDKELNGRPYLSSGFRELVDFNLTHTRGLAMVAVGKGLRFGVDAEELRPNAWSEELAASCLTARETEAIRALDDAERDRAFLRCWTRKEAVMKATGRGLSLDPRDLDVPVEPGEALSLLASRDAAAQPAGDWWLSDVEAGAGFVAAIAVFKSKPSVSLQPWTGESLAQLRARQEKEMCHDA
ncbi:MAG: 4'-phosphopantetheinyl transferase superfamily protein [Bryobacteraceae bacterium]